MTLSKVSAPGFFRDESELLDELGLKLERLASCLAEEGRNGSVLSHSGWAEAHACAQTLKQRVELNGTGSPSP